MDTRRFSSVTASCRLSPQALSCSSWGPCDLYRNSRNTTRIEAPAFRSLRRLAVLVEHWPQLLEKVVDVVELAIHAREADERHGVEVAQIAHHDFAQLAAFHFAIEVLINVL